MPRQDTVLSVFVASPSDVAAERDRLEQVIKEFNGTWGRQFSLTLKLIRWETDAYPGFGTDAQSVINAEIPDDYDIFVGILWARFGTPTGRAGSRTVEEFNRAKQRYDKDNASVKLMIYFKEAPISPSQIDPDQFTRLAAFRKSLGNEGALYWTFNSTDDFEEVFAGT